ncbi:MAG: mycothiol synthase [Acidimicrobiia bacterium]
MASPVPTDPTVAASVRLLRALDDATRSESGHEAFPEAVWAAAERSADDPAVLMTWSADGSVAVLTAPSDTFQPQHRHLYLGAAPDADRAAIDTVLEHAMASEREGFAPGELVAWLPGTDPVLMAALTDVGFEVDRRQHRMQVALPVAATASWPPGIEPRNFRPGTDAAAWLRVNNRAFLNHPEQGGWIAEVLARRMAEPWFDPDGFLLAWRSDELVGFCWTKVHPGALHIGEIFVIGVDPDAQGLGLGRTLVLDGLRYLSETRGCPTGELYVAASNVAALGLYDAIGFEIVRTDTAMRTGSDRS